MHITPGNASAVAGAASDGRTHHSLLPDLGQIIHRVLARDPIPCALSAVVEQCIPRFRHTSRSIRYSDSQGPLLTITMALLLGTYQGGVKKPGFTVRARLFGRIHSLLTSSPEAQSEFCKHNEDVLLLGCMEYLARVLPVHMPVQNRLLTDGDSATLVFYRRIPALCDELRQGLVEGGDISWDAIRRECSVRVERVSRLKRCHPMPPPQRNPLHGELHALHSELSSGLIEAYWNVPILHNGSADEYRLLGLSLNLHGGTIQYIQQATQIFQLPGNLRWMQLDRTQANGRARARASFLQTRLYICMRCMLMNKHQQQAQTRLRLDTLKQRLVCATCLSPDPVCVNMVGRVLLYRKAHYYLCPGCSTVRQYQGGEEQPWTTTCSHTQAPTQHGPASHGRHKPPCSVCTEHVSIQTVRRVDHLTGEMQQFHYCQRHVPRHDTMRRSVNARQMDGAPCRTRKGMPLPPAPY